MSLYADLQSKLVDINDFPEQKRILAAILSAHQADEARLKQALRDFLKKQFAQQFTFRNDPLTLFCVFIAHEIADDGEPIISLLFSNLQKEALYIDESYTQNSLIEFTETQIEDKRQLKNLSQFMLNEKGDRLIVCSRALESVLANRSSEIIDESLPTAKVLSAIEKNRLREWDTELYDQYLENLQIEKKLWVTPEFTKAWDEEARDTLKYEFALLIECLKNGGNTRRGLQVHEEQIAPIAEKGIRRFYKVWNSLTDETREWLEYASLGTFNFYSLTPLLNGLFVRLNLVNMELNNNVSGIRCIDAYSDNLDGFTVTLSVELESITVDLPDEKVVTKQLDDLPLRLKIKQCHENPPQTVSEYIEGFDLICKAFEQYILRDKYFSETHHMLLDLILKENVFKAETTKNFHDNYKAINRVVNRFSSYTEFPDFKQKLFDNVKENLLEIHTQNFNNNIPRTENDFFENFAAVCDEVNLELGSGYEANSFTQAFWGATCQSLLDIKITQFNVNRPQTVVEFYEQFKQVCDKVRQRLTKYGCYHDFTKQYWQQTIQLLPQSIISQESIDAVIKTSDDVIKILDYCKDAAQFIGDKYFINSDESLLIKAVTGGHTDVVEALLARPNITGENQDHFTKFCEMRPDRDFKETQDDDAKIAYEKYMRHIAALRNKQLNADNFESSPFGTHKSINEIFNLLKYTPNAEFELNADKFLLKTISCLGQESDITLASKGENYNYFHVLQLAIEKCSPQTISEILENQDPYLLFKPFWQIEYLYYMLLLYVCVIICVTPALIAYAIPSTRKYLFEAINTFVLSGLLMMDKCIKLIDELIFYHSNSPKNFKLLENLQRKWIRWAGMLIGLIFAIADRVFSILILRATFVAFAIVCLIIGPFIRYSLLPPMFLKTLKTAINIGYGENLFRDDLRRLPTSTLIVSWPAVILASLTFGWLFAAGSWCYANIKTAVCESGAATNALLVPGYAGSGENTSSNSPRDTYGSSLAFTRSLARS
ncbi:MAG: hypothetical protein WC756_20785 [Taibaiella sp.]|jgi:hypothetical protein